MEFNLSLKRNDLQGYVKNQLDTFFPDNEKFACSKIEILIENSLDRIEYCFSKILKKNYCYNGEVMFNHLFSDHYCSFLYFMSNEAYNKGFTTLYNKLSILNKYLHGIELFGHIEMPKIFQLVHPIGTIIGRASMSDYLTIYQGVTIGGAHSDNGIIYPKLGEGVSLFAKSMILGDCVVGDNVNMAANSFIINISIPKNKTVLGVYPSVKMRENEKSNIALMYGERRGSDQ